MRHVARAKWLLLPQMHTAMNTQTDISGSKSEHSLHLACCCCTLSLRNIVATVSWAVYLCAVFFSLPFICSISCPFNWERTKGAHPGRKRGRRKKEMTTMSSKKSVCYVIRDVNCLAFCCCRLRSFRRRRVRETTF